jgi:hypothetical protein
MEFVASWDNSASNPLNPDPSQEVRWGVDTTAEMYGAAAYYTPMKKNDHPLMVKDGLLVERLDTQPQ